MKNRRRIEEVILVSEFREVNNRRDSLARKRPEHFVWLATIAPDRQTKRILAMIC
jgi:hypothetical protein